MKQILNDLVKQWWNSPLPTIKPREIDLTSYFDPKVKKIISVIGFRRVGKTFTLLSFANKYGKEKCVYINFEDERIPKKTEVLSVLVDLLTEIRGDEPLVLLMDEIQEIPDWSMWARRVNEAGKYKLILSGSSSKLSSREIPTELRGQTITIPVFPLSWMEFLDFRGVDIKNLPNANKLNLMRDYAFYGGMPEIVLAEEGLRALIISDYLSSFVERDLVERYNIRKTEVLSDLLRLLTNTRSFTYSKLTNSLNSLGHKVSKVTIIRYLQWLEWSFYMSHLEIYSGSAKNKIKTMKKAYLIDNYFSSHFSSTMSADYGHLMEQLVFQSLYKSKIWDPRRDVAYWKDYLGYEVDFVTHYNREVGELIQVTYASNRSEINIRETKSLLKACDKLKLAVGTVITWDLSLQEKIDGIEIKFIPLWKWLG